MDFQLSEEHLMIRNEVRKFAQEVIELTCSKSEWR